MAIFQTIQRTANEDNEKGKTCGYGIQVNQSNTSTRAKATKDNGVKLIFAG